MFERVTLEFTRAEKRFIEDNDVARLATAGPDGIPHLVPDCYDHSSDAFWVATDHGTENTAISRGTIKSSYSSILATV